MAFDTVDTSSKTSTGQSYNNQYDLQRSQVRDEEAKRRKLEQEAIQRSLASRGFQAGSGFAEAQQNALQQSNLAGERARLRDIDINQLTAAEAAAEAERGRAWQTGERIGSQEYGTSERLGTQGFQTSEREGQQRYGTSERLGTQAYNTGEREAQQRYGKSERLGTQDYNTAERLGTQEYQAGQNQADRNIQLQQQADDMLKFASEQDFKYWAAERGYTEAEMNRAWQTSERKSTQEFESAEADLARNYEWDFTNFKNILEQGNLDYRTALDNNNAALKIRTDYLYAAGANGTPIDTSNMSQIEKDSYNAGIEGRSKAYVDSMVNNLTTANATAITTMVEHPELMTKVYEQMDRLNAAITMIMNGSSVAEVSQFLKSLEESEG